MQLSLSIFFVLLTVAFSGLFSGAETGIISINRIQVASKGRSGSKNARWLLKMMKTPEELLAVLLLGNNITIVTGSVLSASIARDLFGNYGPPVATVVMTVVLLIFGEILPKIFFYQYSLSALLIITPFIKVINVLFYHFARFFRTISEWILFLIPGKNRKKSRYMTKEELKLMMSPYEHFVQMPFYEKEMIYRALQYSDTKVKDVMVALVDVFSISKTAMLTKAVQIIERSGHSRIAVYSEKPHQFSGIITAKDILKKGENKKYVSELMQTPKYVSKYQRVDDLVTEFLDENCEMAFTIDEYGEIAGIVTLEDLVEEIVGEIEDEHDLHNDPVLEKARDGSRIILGNMGIAQFNDYFKSKLPDSNSKSIAGFIIFLIQRIPNENEIIAYGKWKFKIIEATPQRIQRIKVTRIRG